MKFMSDYTLEPGNRLRYLYGVYAYTSNWRELKTLGSEIDEANRKAVDRIISAEAVRAREGRGRNLWEV